MLNLFLRLFNLCGSLRGDMAKITDYNDVAPIAVAGAVTVRSKSFDARYFDNTGLFLLLAGTSPNITITIEESPQPPASTNKNAADPYFVAATGVPPVCTALTIKTAVIQTLSLVPMKHFRFVITGNAGNSGDVTVDLRLFEQELLS